MSIKIRDVELFSEIINIDGFDQQEHYFTFFRILFSFPQFISIAQFLRFYDDPLLYTDEYQSSLAWTELSYSADQWIPSRSSLLPSIVSPSSHRYFRFLLDIPNYHYIHNIKAYIYTPYEFTFYINGKQYYQKYYNKYIPFPFCWSPLVEYHRISPIISRIFPFFSRMTQSSLDINRDVFVDRNTSIFAIDVFYSPLYNHILSNHQFDLDLLPFYSSYSSIFPLFSFYF